MKTDGSTDTRMASGQRTFKRAGRTERSTSPKKSSATEDSQDYGWSKMLEIAMQPVDGRPPGGGWMHLGEISERDNIQRSTAQYRVGKWRKLGLIEEAWGRTDRGQRTLYVRPKQNSISKPRSISLVP